MGKISLIILSATLCCISLFGQHPNLTINKSELHNIREGVGKLPFFDKALAITQEEVDQEIALGIDVPVPKDMAGGYTHERHKRNFFILQKAGNLYQITGDVKYAAYCKEMLLTYAKIYPTLPLHPTHRSYATGKIFWQCLNDANWLVYVSQTYDCVYDYLTADERALLEKDLFLPMADFLSIENPKFFNRIHNHSTWANAAVGMIAIVMGNDDLLQRALYGIQNDNIDENAVDNDGGYIKIDGVRQAGFLAQLDHSFAPDGYFTEGPYYLRYAIFPFLQFARALQNSKPELNIFNYRDSILLKAVDALLQQTDDQGQFFPINDAQKGMSISAREVLTAVDVMYYYFDERKDFLDVVQSQQNVLLDGAGFKAAYDSANESFPPFKKKSVVYGDGAKGNEGGVAVIRNDDFCAMIKYSAQGMGHGHFDKLSYSLYDAAGEIVQDYGAVRWVNIDQKGGGRYLPENKTFGKQSIVHNTLVWNETSHYNAEVKLGSASHPELIYADFSDPTAQVVCIEDHGAYDSLSMQRIFFMFDDAAFPNPILLDVMRAKSPSKGQFDLPFWYMGHLLQTNIRYEKNLTQLKTVGTQFGYEHLWEEAKSTDISENQMNQLNWMNNGKFYTLSSVANKDSEFIFARAGAQDVNFNLRADPVLIERRKNVSETTFVNCIESHGKYDPISEIPENPYSNIEQIDLVMDNKDITVINISYRGGIEYLIMLPWHTSSITPSNFVFKGETINLGDKTQYIYKIK